MKNVWAYILVFLAGMVCGAYVQDRMTRVRAEKTIMNIDFTTQLDRINEGIVQLASSRCMSVNTPVLNVNVYDTPNLGVKKVPPPSRNTNGNSVGSKG